MKKCYSDAVYRVVAIFIFFSLITTATLIRIQCRFQNGGGWKILVDQYQCASSLDSASKNTIVDGIDGDHLVNKTNNHVNGLFLHGKSIKYVPRNIATHFPNLEGLWFFNTEITEITSEDLKPFPKLKAFYLIDSNLAHLGPNLFEFNPKLKYIKMSNNQIAGLARNVFHGIEHLNEIDLSGNICISMHASTEHEIMEMQRLIGEKCKNEAIAPSDAIEAHNSSGDDIATLKVFIAEQISDLKKVTTAQINDLRKTIDDLHQEMKRLHASYDNMTTF